MGRWMLYGANGFTGELIARRAAAKGKSPVVAGRSQQPIDRIAAELKLDRAVFDLTDNDAIKKQLECVDAVLHCAGPFSRTSKPLLDACISSGTHYLDITGEIDVFESCHARHDEAVSAGCVVIPGVGFDVVPTDCLAAALAAALSSATTLELAFHGATTPSRGTAKTMVEGLSFGGAIRKNGHIESVPIAWKSQQIPFRDRLRSAVTIPWGDVSTAYYSTGIENISVYMAMPPKVIRRMRWLRPIQGLLGYSWVKALLNRGIDTRVKGPSVDLRARATSQVWGRVTDSVGQVVEGTLVTPEAYRLTVETALEAVSRVAKGYVVPGTHTPSSAFGSGFIEEFEGCSIQIDTDTE